MSSQGVVERATSEISKRINNLTLGKNKTNAKHNSNNNNNNNNNQNNLKTSVMERVTNVFCGSGHIPSTHLNPTSKTSCRSKSANNVVTSSITPSQLKRKIPNQSSALIGYNRNNNNQITSISDLMLDEAFLAKFFFYFSSLERSTFAQVCFKWKEVLNKNPKYWTGLIPVIRCKELRSVHINDMNKLYSSIVRRNFQCISLLSATDEDVIRFINAFPLASKHIRSLNLSCSSVTDRGLETLMDHLQVRGYSALKIQ